MDHISKVTSASITRLSEGSSEPLLKAKPSKLAQNLCDTLSLKMAEIYGHRWTASFGERIDQDHAWASVLAGMTGAQIATGLNHLVSARLAWPPTAPEFL